MSGVELRSRLLCCGCFDVLIAVELRAVIQSECSDRPRRLFDHRRRAPGRRLDSSLDQFSYEHVAGFAIDHRESAMLVRPPMTVSPSRCPIRDRFSAAKGRSEMWRLPARRPRES